MQQDFKTDQLVPVEPRHMISIPEGWNCGYSINWMLGGPIIEREGLSVEPFKGRANDWRCFEFKVGHVYAGPTPLIAAMRCFIASRLGDEVEIPEDLK